MEGNSPEISLPLYLRLFFGLNGITLGLEGLGLMFIINSKVELPIPYLPTYGALAFLPYSFKPLYGYLSQKVTSRFQLFASLLLANAVSLLATLLIPKGGIFLACFVAFLRGVTDSWAELCLGLTLIDSAWAQSMTDSRRFDAVTSKFQAQSATSRNCGSFLAYGCTFIAFTGRQFLFTRTSRELNSTDAHILLISSASLQLAGAVYACFHRDIFQVPGGITQEFSSVQQDNDHGDSDGGLLVDEMSSLRDDENSYSSCSSANDDADGAFLLTPSRPLQSGSSLFRYNYALVVLLQITVLILAMQRPIVEISSHLLWKVSLMSCLLVTILVGLASIYDKLWAASHSVGLYLILKHAIPSDSMVLGAYFYSLFQASPGLLQGLALLGSGITTLSSWSYGRYMSNYNSGGKFLILIAATTILASAASLGNVIVFRQSHSEHLVGIVVFVKSLESFFAEWEFLPDTVLAATSLSLTDFHTPNAINPCLDDPRNGNVGVKYGALISCIDFGDQLGSLVSGPLVVFLGISRENNFAHLDHMIFVCFYFRILALLLLVLLKNKR